MKALSIRQPWAWLILHAGKDVENRDWSSRYPAYHEACCMARDGARILIHASKSMTRDEHDGAVETARMVGRIRPFPPGLRVPVMKELQRGGIVGSARIAHVVTNHTSPWFFGKIGLVLCDVRPEPFRELKGALGFFEVPDVVIEAGGVDGGE